MIDLGISLTSLCILNQGGGVRGFVGLTVDNVARMRTAREAAKAGTSRGKIAFGGSSTMARETKAGSIPAEIANFLSTLGTPSECLQSLWGTANYYSTYSAYDTRLTTNANWTEGTIFGPGGPVFRDVVASTDSGFSFLPPDAYDNAIVHFAQWSTAATVKTRINGVDKGNTGLVGTSGALLSVPYNASLAQQALSVAKTTATANRILIAGIECWDSTNPKLSIFGMGWGGSRASDWAATTYGISPPNMLPTLGLSGYNMLNMLNEWLGGVTVADYITSQDANVAAAKAYTDVVVWISQFSDPVKTGVPLATQSLYREAGKAIAVSHGVPYFDLVQVIGDFETANAAGYYRSDGYHLTDAANIAIANAWARGFERF